MAVSHHDDAYLPIVDQASTANNPLGKNQFSDVEFGAHQLPNRLSTHAEHRAIFYRATVEQRWPVVQQVQFTTELKPGHAGCHLARGSSFSFVQFQFALNDDKKIHQPLALLEEVNSRFDRLSRTVALQTPHHGWGHTCRA